LQMTGIQDMQGRNLVFEEGKEMSERRLEYA
jgi:hypothetical protein